MATAAMWWIPAIALEPALDAASAPAATAAATRRRRQAPAPQRAPAPRRPANPSNDATELQEIVVTGLRASLERSLDTKRNAAVVMDSISATELGRFPDADVADSLSHIPGVTITRTTGGEGLRINVRGLGPDYNIVTLNNRILATDDDGRQLAFDVLPSELISGADVLKSSQASALEGSIGGTVNLRTASSFDNPGFHGGAHAETNYNDMSQLHGNKFSAFLTDTNKAETMGFVLGAVSFEDQHPHRFAQCLQPEHLRADHLPLRRLRKRGAAGGDAVLHHLRLDLRRQKARRLYRQPRVAPERGVPIGGRRDLHPLERSAIRIQRVVLLRGQSGRDPVDESGGQERRGDRRHLATVSSRKS